MLKLCAIWLIVQNLGWWRPIQYFDLTIWPGEMSLMYCVSKVRVLDWLFDHRPWFQNLGIPLAFRTRLGYLLGLSKSWIITPPLLTSPVCVRSWPGSGGARKFINWHLRGPVTSVAVSNYKIIQNQRIILPNKLLLMHWIRRNLCL